jgi:hypothetical protein
MWRNITNIIVFVVICIGGFRWPPLMKYIISLNFEGHHMYLIFVNLGTFIFIVFCIRLYRSNFNRHCTVNDILRSLSQQFQSTLHCYRYPSKFIATILIDIAPLTISFEVYRSNFNWSKFIATILIYCGGPPWTECKITAISLTKSNSSHTS